MQSVVTGQAPITLDVVLCSTVPGSTVFTVPRASTTRLTDCVVRGQTRIAIVVRSPPGYVKAGP